MIVAVTAPATNDKKLPRFVDIVCLANETALDHAIMSEFKSAEAEDVDLGVDDGEEGLLGDGEEETLLEQSGSAEETEFDMVCGAIEEILVGDEEFLSIQRGFCEQHCDVFNDSEENKIEYTALFEEYTGLMERTLEERLAAKVPGFNMRRFELQLVDRKDEIGGEIFDLLLSFSDFGEFKATILAHKASTRQGEDGPSGLSLTGTGLSLGGLGISGKGLGGSKR
jgi:ADP-ribosylation factor 2-binding protein